MHRLPAPSRASDGKLLTHLENKVIGAKPPWLACQRRAMRVSHLSRLPSQACAVLPSRCARLRKPRVGGSACNEDLADTLSAGMERVPSRRALQTCRPNPLPSHLLDLRDVASWATTLPYGQRKANPSTRAKSFAFSSDGRYEAKTSPLHASQSTWTFLCTPPTPLISIDSIWSLGYLAVYRPCGHRASPGDALRARRA